MSSFINLIAQSTTAIASAAGQSYRFSQLVTQPYTEGSALRVAGQSTAALSGAAGQLATLANLVSAGGTTAADRNALTRGLAHMGAGLADIDRSLQQVTQGINTAVDANNQLSASARSLSTAKQQASDSLQTLHRKLGSGQELGKRQNIIKHSSNAMPTLTGPRSHLLILIAEQGQRYFFGLTTAAFDKFQRKISYNVIAQERLARPDALQAINQGGETIILSGVVFAQFSGISQLDELREIGFK
ncbi:MAG: phage tail protein [Candidatus Symbiodolus clandestinus]